jgi:hypothetical protein
VGFHLVSCPPYLRLLVRLWVDRRQTWLHAIHSSPEVSPDLNPVKGTSRFRKVTGKCGFMPRSEATLPWERLADVRAFLALFDVRIRFIMQTVPLFKMYTLGCT